MNFGLASPEPMTDLGRLLTGPQGDDNLNYLLRALGDEEMRVTRLLSTGLEKEQYARALRRVTALQYASIVLKSLRIFLTS